MHDYGTPNGGAEAATLLLRDGLRARGHDALLLASSARAPGVPTEADVECLGTVGRGRTLLQSANVPARRAVARVVADFRPDVVHVGMFLTQLSPLILPALRHTPTVFQAHWLRAICPTGSKLLPDGAPCGSAAGVACYRHGCLPLRDWTPLMAQARLLRRWRGHLDRVVANSEATRGALEAEGYENVAVIPCGVPRAAPPTEPRADAPTVCFCGRLTRQKGVHVLLAAWDVVRRHVPDARLLIVGDGPERQRLEQSAPPGVSFLGHLPHAEAGRVVGAAWVQAVPSLGFESFGMVAVEAMMRGTAVVASRAGGLPEVVTDGDTGTLVPPGDADALAAALTALLLDRGRRERMGERGRRSAEERFAVELYVDRFVALYEALLLERRTA